MTTGLRWCPPTHPALYRLMHRVLCPEKNVWQEVQTVLLGITRRVPGSALCRDPRVARNHLTVRGIVWLNLHGGPSPENAGGFEAMGLPHHAYQAMWP